MQVILTRLHGACKRLHCACSRTWRMAHDQAWAEAPHGEQPPRVERLIMIMIMSSPWAAPEALQLVCSQAGRAGRRACSQAGPQYGVTCAHMHVQMDATTPWRMVHVTGGC